MIKMNFKEPLIKLLITCYCMNDLSSFAFPWHLMMSVDFDSFDSKVCSILPFCDARQING